jgi:2-isopropylmalate synthase
MGLPTATVKMVGPDGITRAATGMGTGPVDAAYKAIDSLVRVQVREAKDERAVEAEG